jgi:hypothetical protein
MLDAESKCRVLKHPIGPRTREEATTMEERINLQIYHPIKWVHILVDEVVVVKTVKG